MYEFIGTALLSLASNLEFGMVIVPHTLLIVSIWSWELSSAHFNICITIAQLIFNVYSDRDSSKTYYAKNAAILIIA